MAYDWNTIPMPRYSGATFRRVALENTTWLPIRISPASGVTRPATQRSRVVFPEPLGPSSTKNSLSPTSMSTPRSAATLVVCPGNIFSTPCTLIIKSPSADYSLASSDHKGRALRSECNGPILIRVPSVQIVQIVPNVLNNLNSLNVLNPTQRRLIPRSTLCRGFSSHRG